MADDKRKPVVHTVTSAPSSPADDQDQRVRRYLTMMGIRIACLGLIFVTDGWLRWAAIIGAVVLPYFAVVTANAVRPRQSGEIEPVSPHSVTPPPDPNRLGQ
ncbi:DUF3099 domain-containing protein [Intrasporangium calvum]|uniref:DUF3099 domain-containing protein n=1 Tax=Intrasporangium calvum TaxID=53358 RepID=A0ABT5GGS3_9MICO|nr:DUF3099 domain-containing protein [Intrasporangium calvum]MDC5697414.1 DUF3099 domain-containing protein [Intrasporangium calvum]